MQHELPLRRNPTTRGVIRQLPPAWRDFAVEHVQVVQAIVDEDLERRKARLRGGIQVVEGGRGTSEGGQGTRRAPPSRDMPRETAGPLLDPVNRTVPEMDPDLFKRTIENSPNRVRMPAGLLFQSRHGGPVYVTTEEFVVPEKEGGLTAKVNILELTPDGWTSKHVLRVTRKDLVEQPPSPLTPQIITGLEDTAGFLEYQLESVKRATENRRREEEAERVRLEKRAEEAPYIETIFRLEAKDRWFPDSSWGIPDTYEARVLRKLFKKLGVPLSIKVRRYSMASGFDLSVDLKAAPPGSTQSTLPADSAAGKLAAQVLPTAVRLRTFTDYDTNERVEQYSVDHSFYLREQEDRSDLQTDYHDPGGDRIGQQYVETLRQLIRKTKPTKRERR